MSDKKQWYLRVGNMVNIQKGKYVEPEEKRTWISKGTSLVLGFDKKLHNGNISMDLQKNMNVIDGVSATGLSDFVYYTLLEILPMEEIMEEYEIDEYEIKEELDEAFARIGAIAD